MKYNFKVGEKVQIYRKPVSGLGVKPSELPGVGSEGIIVTAVENNHVSEGMNVPYVRVKFKDDSLNNSKHTASLYWAIPCSCLKRVKIIKVAAKTDPGGWPLCIGVSGDECCYFASGNCVESGRFPACSEESIIYVEVKNDT